MIRSALPALVTIALTASPAIAEPVQWTIASGGNGHWYEYIGDPVPAPSDWASQQANAVARGGYLATITSEAENRFISTNLGVGALGGCTCVWLGAFQNPNSPTYSEPAGGWEWVTGEPMEYTNWASGEPNNSGSEDFLTTWFSPDTGNVSWNDHFATGSGRYIIEWDTDPSAQPSIAVIDFESLPEGFVAPFTTGGYSITTVNNPNPTYNQAIVNVGGTNQNVVVDGSPENDFGTSMEISRVDGVPFRLVSLSIANLAADSAPGNSGISSCPTSGYVLRVSQVISGTGFEDLVGRCDAYYPTSSTFLTVSAEPLAENVSKLWLDIVGNFSSNWAFDDIVLEAIPASCTGVGAFSPSTPTLAASQNNHCEDWFGVSQPGADLRNAVLSLADLGSSNLSGSLLMNSDLSGANLAGANLINTRLESANLRGTIMTSSNFSFANLTGASYDESTVFPSGNQYDELPSGLDGDITPWAARMIPAPEPSSNPTLILGFGTLLTLSAKRRTTTN